VLSCAKIGVNATPDTASAPAAIVTLSKVFI
jgi:hypothetical protein